MGSSFPNKTSKKARFFCVSEARQAKIEHFVQSGDNRYTIFSICDIETNMYARAQQTTPLYNGITTKIN